MFKALLETLTAENTKITEFRDVTSSRSLDGYERFVGKYCSFCSVRQNVGDIRLVHYMQQPPLKSPSSASLHYYISVELLR